MAKPEADATVDKREMSKGKAALLIFLSGLAAVLSALGLHGWHVYLGLAIVGVGLTIGFARWARK
jgi:hypothetical protein